MLETRAIVIRVEGAEAVVEARQEGGCGQCDSVNGCGGSKLSKMFCSTRPRYFRVPNDIAARPGEEVRLTVADGVLLRSAILLYVLPLTLLLGGGFLGSRWAEDTASRDGYAVIGALLGLAVGFALAKWLASAVASRSVVARRAEAGRPA